MDAIREIVVNMVVHRDYRDSSASIIKIFDNRIEFFNPGKLYEGITIQDLLSGNYTSKSRNKLIARAFKETGIIERYGSGIMRVRKICKEYGVREPDFIEISNGFQVILYNEKVVDTKKLTDKDTNSDIDTNKDTNKDTNSDTNKDTNSDTNKDTNSDTNKDTNSDTDKDTNKLTEIQKIILKKIENNKNITLSELSKAFNINIRNIKNNISKLKDKGFLERVGNNKSGYWEIKQTLKDTDKDTDKDTNSDTNSDTNKDTNSDTNSDTDKDTNSDTNKDTNKLTEIQKIILKKIENNKNITLSELSKAFNINIRNTKNNISKLKDKGFLERVGNNKSGYWEIKDIKRHR
ncbi:MAG: HTH domain-containing protein [Dysgonamonadaceae bacterium]|jgi:predicted HTH transcriptional regulator|nr:HTH domain-containing protein [Dysgonamonadaceae bacterium]